MDRPVAESKGEALDGCRPFSGYNLSAMAKKQKLRRGVLAGISEHGETLLKRYLNERGWQYRWHSPLGHKELDAWHSPSGHKKLDAIVVDEHGSPIAVFEVTYLPDMQPGSEKPQDVAFLEKAIEHLEQGEAFYMEIDSETPLHSLQARLSKKKKQAEEAAKQRLPFMLVIYAPALTLCNSPHDKVRELFRDNPEFSAIGVINEVSAIDTVRRLYRNNNLPGEVQNLLQCIYQMLKERYGYHIEDTPQELEAIAAQEHQIATADLKLVVLETFLNPCAYLPWPPTLVGVYDTVYGWREAARAFEVISEGGFALLRRYAAHLLAGSVSVPWQEAISTSRSENFYEERDPVTHSA